jgi:serpin B
MTASLFGTLPRSKAAEDPKNGQLVAGNTAFATDLYQREKSNPGNLFFSPYSISTALAMTYAGAAGKTADEMGRTLHLGLPQAEVPPAFASLIGQINEVGKTGSVKLDTANSLWCQQDFPLLESYFKIVHSDFYAEARQVDFVKETEPTRVAINSWVAQKTQDKIKDLLQPGQLSADTRLVLCNAIYFKGQWMNPFQPTATHPAPFFTGNGQQTQVPLMNQTLSVRSRQMDGFTAFSLPYISNSLSLFILLPQSVDGLQALEQKVNSEDLRQWLSSVDSAPEVKSELSLPKFKMTCRLELAPALSALGMGTAFSRAADFSGISSKHALSISEVVHQAYIDVNEEGTEAAAATGAIMRLTASVQRTPVLRVDHPFLFLIRDNHTGSVLFLGRVIDPSKG